MRLSTHAVRWLALLLALSVSSSAMGQDRNQGVGFSGELGLGIPVITEGPMSLTGIGAVRVHFRSNVWAVGLRAMAADGEQRQTGGFWGSAIETHRMAAGILYRIIPLSGDNSALYLGTGVSRLWGREFVGPSGELEDLSRTGLSFEAALHLPRTGSRLVCGVHGYLGAGGPLGIASIAVAGGR